MVSPAGHVSDHHVGHGHDLAVLGLLNEDGDPPGDELAVELDALSTSYELPIAVVACKEKSGSIDVKSKVNMIQNNPTNGMILSSKHAYQYQLIHYILHFSIYKKQFNYYIINFNYLSFLVSRLKTGSNSNILPLVPLISRFIKPTLNKADTLKTTYERTQLSVLRAAKGVEVSFTVHHHAELCTTSHLHQGLTIVGDLEEEREDAPT